MKIIAYVLIHNFYVTAARSTDPGLGGRPLAVLKKNLVLDASPEAFQSGVFSGMPRRHAVQACPELAFAGYKSGGYTARTLELATRCYSLSPRVEAIDENGAFLDLSGKNPPAVSVLRELAGNLVPQLGSFITIGLATNRFLAKAAAIAWTAATRQQKNPVIPGLIVKNHGIFNLCIVRPEVAPTWASGLPIELLWPLEESVIKRLKSLGVNSLADINIVPLTILYREFNSLAPLINQYSKGIDKTNVPVMHGPEQILYHSACPGADKSRLEYILKEAAAYISSSLRNRGESYRQLTLSVFFADIPVITKTSSFTRGKFEMVSVFYDSLNLLNKIVINKDITEIVITAGWLQPSGSRQMALFEGPGTLAAERAARQKKLSIVCKNLTARYYSGVITTGKALPVSRREQMLMFVDPLRS